MATVLADMKKYEKLVRDRIPEIIEGEGKAAVWRELSDEEFRLALKAKALEEAVEVVDASDDALLSELADLSEVIDGILRAYNLSREDLEAVRRRKNEERGGFDRRLFLESVSD
jgi:predicted house-cleaning noncanonical NTP pyrophosphatase (MazG superfamily)